MSVTRLILICVFSIFYSQSVIAQTDTDFWFAVPEASINGNGQDRPIKLYFTTYAQGATVQVTRPAVGSTLTSMNIGANVTASFDLTPWIDSLEVKPASTVLPYGLHIVSTAPITVYYEVVSGLCDCNPETFVLKGANALGTDFWIPAQNIYDNAPSTPLSYSSFDIVATDNNTTVTITPADDIQGNHLAGIPFNVVLDSGETYSATAATQAAAKHLAGSRVVSDKPIAITVKDDQLWMGPNTCADLTGDQIVPVRIIGKEYVAVNGYLTFSDQLFITAIANNTDIFENGVYVTTINAGQTHHIQMSGSSVYITSSEKVYVLQVSGIGCELGSALLPAIGCTGSYSVSFSKSAVTPLHVNLLTTTGGQGNFLVNGAPGIILPTQFSPVPGTGGAYHFARVQLAAAQNTPISVTNTTTPFHLGVLHGSNKTGARFGYFSNYESISPVAWTNSPACEGDSVVLSTQVVSGATYAWSGPAGFSSNVPNPVIYPVTASASGVYTLQMGGAGCTGVATVELKVLPRPTLHVTPSVSYVCPTDSITITASGADSFLWSPAAGLNTNIGAVVKASPGTNTTYIVTSMDSDKCPAKDSVEVRIGEALDVKVTPRSAVVCIGGSTQLTASGANSYTWDPPVGLSATTGSTVIASGIQGTTKYIVTGVSSDGCIGRDSAMIYVGDTVRSVAEMLICSDSSLNFGSLTIKDSGTYVQAFKTHAGCDSVVTMHVGFNEALTADFYFDPIIPELNKPIQFTNRSMDAVSYKWNFGDGYFSEEESPLYMFKKSGIFNVCLTVRNELFCPDILCKDVEAEVYPNINVPSAFSPNGDGMNDILYLLGGAVEEVHFRVYNRWGELVFESNSMNQGWDGSYRGVQQEAEVYAYTVYATFIDGVQYSTSGNITLIR